MRLVCSERFSGQDIAALSAAVQDRPRWFRHSLEGVAPTDDDADRDCPAYLASLVARGKIRIKVALVDSGLGRSMYHEKIGIWYDNEKMMLAISGSANESWNAYVGNYERLDLFPSWKGGSEATRNAAIRESFESLWGNTSAGVRVVDLIFAVQNRLLVEEPQRERRTAPRPRHDVPAPPQTPQEVLVPPADFVPMPHQRTAMRLWAGASGKGILEMATGAGKTLAAFAIASALWNAIGPGLCVVVIVPYIHLLDQWVTTATRFGLAPIRCYLSAGTWQPNLQSAVLALNSGHRPLLSVIVTASTMQNSQFRQLIRAISKPVLVVADECHNYGSSGISRALPSSATYRLGLSATPQLRDPPSAQRLHDYFGDIIFRYDLGEAIADGVLTHYLYFPHTVPLDDDEFVEYSELTRAIGRYLGSESLDGEMSEPLKHLLMRRARLLGTARGKLPMLRQLLRPHQKDSHILVYCSDGQVEGEVDGALIRQLTETLRIVGEELGMRCSSITAETPREARSQILQSFDSGLIQVLVAIRCLDEGVDVPATRTAYLLASSTNPRQFVQRRGRVLRRHPGKLRAEVHDVFVSPPKHAIEDSTTFSVAQGLIRGQLTRVAQFAQLADNGPVARRGLLDVLEPYGLLGTWEREDLAD